MEKQRTKKRSQLLEEKLALIEKQRGKKAAAEWLVRFEESEQKMKDLEYISRLGGDTEPNVCKQFYGNHNTFRCTMKTRKD